MFCVLQEVKLKSSLEVVLCEDSINAINTNDTHAHEECLSSNKPTCNNDYKIQYVLHIGGGEMSQIIILSGII